MGSDCLRFAMSYLVAIISLSSSFCEVVMLLHEADGGRCSLRNLRNSFATVTVICSIRTWIQPLASSVH